jgi:hypothetical protein
MHQYRPGRGHVQRFDLVPIHGNGNLSVGYFEERCGEAASFAPEHDDRGTVNVTIGY